MDQSLSKLLDRLADGLPHSGQALADDLGISRTAVWKQINGLRELGLNVLAKRGQGYHLEVAIQRPDEEKIRARLNTAGLGFDLRFLVDSTNSCLQRELKQHPPPRALIAEIQNKGRGRRGRQWVSPPGAGLYLSLAWRFDSGLLGLSTLSLVTGVAVADVLKSIGVDEIGLKWPNDLMVRGKKIGGCLIEISGSVEGPCDAVAGLGLNLNLGQRDDIDQPWTDLKQLGIDVGVDIDCNQLYPDIIEAMAEAYRELDRSGFAPFNQAWTELDALVDRRVKVEQGQHKAIEGTARGVDDQGRLLIETLDGLQAIGSGEVRVRAC